MYSFEVLSFLKGKCNSSSPLIILTIVPAVSFLLYKNLIVAFSPHFLVRKNKLSIASSLFEEKEDIFCGNIIFNLPECLRYDIGTDICNLSERIHQDISSAKTICNRSDCIGQDNSSADTICILSECIYQDTSSADTIFNLSESIKEDALDTDIIGKLSECIKQDISDGDIICNLPECIKHKILVYLPIKEAVRTSILSKDWRHTWTAIPDLVIDCNIDPTFNENIGDKEESMIEKFVNQLLSCHKGNLHKFRVSGLKSRMLFTSSWMRILSQKHISEFILEACPYHQYISLSDIKLCLKLRVLVLSSCGIYLPSKFDGFKLLHTIELRDCCLLDKGITDLVSFCPLLEKLTFKLRSCNEEIIIIDSPSLRELTIYNKFAGLSLLAPNLYTVKFVTTSRTVELRGNFIKLPVYINYTLSVNASSYILQKYPPTLDCLTTIVMIVAPPNWKLRTYNANQLFGASMLRKLIVYLEPIYPSTFFNTYKIQDQIFPFLREAIIIPFFSSEIVFEFAEFILIRAPQLKRLIIRGEIKDSEVPKWNEIRKLSMKAEIILSKSYFNNAEGKFEGCCCSMCDIMAW